MRSVMPPLNALRAFEATARHASMTKAAAELGVTPGALSHQIRGLEALIGAALFVRQARSIALTAAGRRLYPKLRDAFQSVRDAVADLRGGGEEHVLVISTPPGLTAKWLAPRLYRFTEEHPDLDVRVSSSLACANFESDGVDLAVRSLATDAAPDPTLTLEKLADMRFVPVCSPRLLDRHGPFLNVDALAQAPLIHETGPAGMPAWAHWFAAAGVEMRRSTRGLSFSSAEHALDAVIEGAGVLLAQELLAHDDLRSGRLVVAVERRLDWKRAYYLAYPAGRGGSPKVAAFRRWITREFAAMERRPRPSEGRERRRQKQ